MSEYLINDDKDLDSSCSSSEIEIGPQVRQQFSQLAQVLQQTNANLHTFEFMLTQYKQWAKVAPFAVRSPMQQGQDKVQQQLQQLIHTVNSIDAKANDKEEPSENKRITELESQLTNKTSDCQTYWNANQRLEAELTEEKRKVSNLDQKLDSERKAAQVVAKDIKRYVETMKKLESQIKTQEKENSILSSKISRFEENRANETDDLCQTCLERNSDNTDLVLEENVQQINETATKLVQELVEERKRRVRLEAELKTQNYSKQYNQELTEERKRRMDLENEHSKCITQAKEYELQLIELRQGLEIVQSDLIESQSLELLRKTQLKLATVKAERNTLKETQVRTQERLSEAQIKLQLSQEALERLRQKSKLLLQKYREKKLSNDSMSLKIEKVKKFLIDLRTVCKIRDENQRKILDHLGNQIEISARLLGAYFGEDIQALDRGTLGVWFCDVQGLASWTHSKLVTLGTRLWTGKDCTERDTISELSHTLTLDEDSAKLAVEAQEKMSKNQMSQHFDSMLSMLSET